MHDTAEKCDHTWNHSIKSYIKAHYRSSCCHNYHGNDGMKHTKYSVIGIGSSSYV